MATPFSNVNIAHMNGKQLRKIARDVNVSHVTIDANAVNQNLATRRAALVTAIKAK